MESLETYLARLGYEAYGNKANWKNYQGNPMPIWEDLPDNIKEYWKANAMAIHQNDMKLVQELKEEFIASLQQLIASYRY